MSATDAWVVADPCACPICGRDSCEDHLPPLPPAVVPPNPPSSRGLDPAGLADATIVAAEGRRLAAEGVPYVIENLVPNLGVLGMVVAFAKVGKTSFTLALGGSAAAGLPFLGRATTQVRVLVIAAEDPPEYTAWLARHLDTLPPGALTFYRRPIRLDVDGLDQIAATVADGGYGLVLIASWQAVIRGLTKDENDNASAVRIVEQVKAATRATGVPWVIDAHSGKGEDQADEADPMKALRGASGAAAAADFVLSLRYAGSPFSSQRRLAGKGRFVAVEPILLTYDLASGTYATLGETKAAGIETAWQLIRDTAAIDVTPRSVAEIARACGLLPEGERLSGGIRKQVAAALHNRPGVLLSQELRRGQPTTLYRLVVE